MTYHEASKTSQTEARATSDWTPTLARIEQLEAEVERLTMAVRSEQLRAQAAEEQVERLRAAVQAVRDLRDETELRNHNSALWQRLNGLIPVLDAALGGERW